MRARDICRGECVFRVPCVGLLLFWLQEPLGAHFGTPWAAFRDSSTRVSVRATGRPSGRPETRPAVSAGGDQSGPNSSPNLFGKENPAPAENTTFNAAGGKPWPFSRKASFARRRADPSPDLSQTLAGDPAGANGASNGGIRAEIRPSLGFLGFRARFARRLRSSGRVGSLPGRRLAGAGAGAGEPAGSPAGLGVARNGRFGITGSTRSSTAGQHHQVHHGAASPRGAPRRLPTP